MCWTGLKLADGKPPNITYSAGLTFFVLILSKYRDLVQGLGQGIDVILVVVQVQ